MDYRHPVGVELMLTISTGHIRESTAQRLDSHCRRMTRATDPWARQPRLRLTVYPKGDYGWWIHVPGDAQAWAECSDTLPPDLADCMTCARKLGCVWLCLDRDGDTLDQLPLYDW
jgi:hypothetical protein